MEALPVIAETGQALGLPLAVTLALIIIATAVLVVVVLRDHRNKIDNAREEVNAVKNDVNKQISEIKAATGKEIAEVKASMEKAVNEIKAEMVRQAAAHNSELSSLYKLVNGVAIDVSFIKGKMTRGTK
jgi:seryl-tRNA synthetase